MRRVIGILLLSYYLIGRLFLPASDFSFISLLPHMYSQCKIQEDQDMNLLDFITDHLLNIDGVFDQHDDGDEQKPHKSPDVKITISAIYFTSPLVYDLHISDAAGNEGVIATQQFLQFDYSADIFKPPIG